MLNSFYCYQRIVGILSLLTHRLHKLEFKLKVLVASGCSWYPVISPAEGKVCIYNISLPALVSPISPIWNIKFLGICFYKQ